MTEYPSFLKGKTRFWTENSKHHICPLQVLSSEVAEPMGCVKGMKEVEVWRGEGGFPEAELETRIECICLGQRSCRGAGK